MAEFRCNDYREEILSLWAENEYTTKKGIALKLIKEYGIEGNEISIIRRVTDFIAHNAIDKEIIVENVKLAKQKQKSQDQNRIANKSFREDARIENAVAELGTELVKINKEYAKELKKIKFKPYKVVTGGVGVIQITDVHGNELINLPNNKYDFHVLAKRMRKHILESLRYFEFHNVNKVVMVFTGDLLNSDRRLDELLNASTNRAKATVLMIHIIKQAIVEVRAKYPVDIISVLGNESRVDKEMSFSNEAFSDNYDFTIIAQLKQIFEFAKIKGVVFKGHDKLKEILDFGQQKWLVSHNLSGTVDNQQKTQSEIGMYSLMGHKIDYSIGGHIHATRITDFSARSGSMSGSNSYNENVLGLLGRASHNCYVVNGKKRAVQINDIQDVDDVVGYEIISQLEAYNAKSNSKLKTNVAIMKIVI